MPASEPLPFHDLESPPDQLSVTSGLSRLIEGIGFRYHWATEGLSDDVSSFIPSKDSMTLGELLLHILRLVHTTNEHFGGSACEEWPPEEQGLIKTRQDTLFLLEALNDRIKNATPQTLNDMGSHKINSHYMINGPLADALTHIGQLNTWRRLAGNPPVKANVFKGIAPKING